MGYDGLELATWGDHLDVFRASESVRYCRRQKSILERNGLRVFAISNALAGQLTCDLNNDARSDAFAPKEVRGDPEGKRRWAIEAVKRSAAARELGRARCDRPDRFVNLAPALSLPAGRRRGD